MDAHFCQRGLECNGYLAYAIEEMVADLGIASDPRPNHAAYIAQWLRIMKGDRKAIFAAASAASTACQYLAGLQDKEQAAA